MSARSSSKEVSNYASKDYCTPLLQSSHYSTISDAVNKLNFEQALNNDGCFPFICQVRYIQAVVMYCGTITDLITGSCSHL